MTKDFFIWHGWTDFQMVEYVNEFGDDAARYSRVDGDPNGSHEMHTDDNHNYPSDRTTLVTRPTAA